MLIIWSKKLITTVLIFSLGFLAGCGSTVTMEVAKIIYNLPGQAEQLEQERKELKNCVKEKRCSEYYWDEATQSWATHRYTPEELEDIATSQSPDKEECLKEKKCTSYKIKDLKQIFVHRYSPEELKILEMNKLYEESEAKLLCLKMDKCVYVPGKGVRQCTPQEIEDLQTRQAEDVEECLRLKKCVAYQPDDAPVKMVHRYSEAELKRLEK